MSESRIAYFSMEIALHPAMPTYSGGLGILAGNMLRAAADRELPMVAVTLLHRKGYFYQTLDGSGWQTEDSVEWIVEDFLHDQGGKEVIKRIFEAKAALKTHVEIAYMVNYDWQLAQLMTAGVDVWLNTPQPPLEASGTSGMKAALNGVPSLSILDGWWIEGCIEGVTGWAIGELPDPGDSDEDRSPRDAASLYDKLERVVVPLFYRDRERFIDVMRHAIALNGSFFNTQRMVLQYVTKAYFY